MYSYRQSKSTISAVDLIHEVVMLSVMDWVDRTRQRMKQLDRKQRELMPVLGVGTLSAVGHYLNRRREPSIAQLEALCVFLDCSLDWLIRGEGQPPGEARKTPKSEPGRELVALLAIAEETIDRYEIEHDIEFTDAETWDLLYNVIDFAAPQHFSDEFVKQYTIELARKARNVN